MLTPAKFRNWVRWAAHGERIVYYRGWIFQDRGPDEHHRRTDDQQAIELLREAVWQAKEKGSVLLFQRRTGSSTYDYYAVRT